MKTKLIIITSVFHLRNVLLQYIDEEIIVHHQHFKLRRCFEDPLCLALKTEFLLQI